jgi:ATP-dependent 26S proteasome regulatory subunit
MHAHIAIVEKQAAAGSQDVLTPSQKLAFDILVETLNSTPIVALGGSAGAGKTMVMRALANSYGGEFVSVDDIVASAERRDLAAAEESVQIALEEALERSDLVAFDDIVGLVAYDGREPRYMQNYKLNALFAKARASGKRLIFGANEHFFNQILSRSPNRAIRVDLEPFTASDYAAVLANLLGAEAVADVDFDLVYAHSSFLSGHDLRNLSGLLIGEPHVTTDQTIRLIEAFLTSTNTRIDEVEELSFDKLPGTEKIAALLETHILLPLEHPELALKLGLKPKRGVLLYGPPGTGKTSIGRALAHRMAGKLHLIDGSFVTEPPRFFFDKVRKIVREAKENAPSIIFIDDADVLFGIEHIAGFSRFLLSLLDGVESETAGKVCVMMTAMNPSKVPAAILRSGRVELWLETHAPDLAVRIQILEKWLGAEFDGAIDINLRPAAAASERFTPADLRRVVGDAKSFYAADRIAGIPNAKIEDYVMRAIEELTATRERMADNLRDDSLRIGVIGPKGKYGTGIGGLVETAVTCSVKGW